MSRTVMVLFDSLTVRKEAFHYAIELAKRMDYSLAVLVLIAHESGDEGAVGDIYRRAKDTLRDPLESARRSGVHVEAEVRMGDPSSELMKYCAVSRSIQTIVWGGSLDVVQTRGNRSHWFARMQKMLECPVVVPSMKS